MNLINQFLVELYDGTDERGILSLTPNPNNTGFQARIYGMDGTTLLDPNGDKFLAVTGPTAEACITALEELIREGYRFWYEEEAA